MDLFTYDIQAALSTAECPLCFADRADELRWMETFIREGHRDAGALRRFISGGGFCFQHGELFADLAGKRDALPVVARVYKSLVDDDITRLRAEQDAPRRRRVRRIGAGWRRSDCTACSSRKSNAERKLCFFCEALTDGAFRRAYVRSRGLCTPHFLAAVALPGAKRRAQLEFLFADWLRRTDELQRSLTEYDRKRDCRYAHEDRGTEQYAPCRHSDTTRERAGRFWLASRACLPLPCSAWSGGKLSVVRDEARETRSRADGFCPDGSGRKPFCFGGEAACLPTIA